MEDEDIAPNTHRTADPVCLWTESHASTTIFQDMNIVILARFSANIAQNEISDWILGIELISAHRSNAQNEL